MNKRNYNLIAVLEFLMVSIFPVQSFAAFIQIDPGEKDVLVNEIFNFNIIVSDLKEDENIGGFDFNFIYDQDIVDYLSCEFNDVLGSGAVYDLDESSIGNVNCFGYSLLSPYEFPQALESVTLATITFKAKNSGTGIFSFSDVIISDAFGDELPVAVSEGKVNVPEPAAPVMLLSSLIVMCMVSCTKKNVLKKESA